MDHLSRYLQWAEGEKGLLETTIESYSRTLRRLDASYDVPLEKLTAEHVRNFLLGLGGAPRTRGVRLAAVRSFYRYLILIDARLDDPTAKILRPKIRKGLPRPIDNPDEAFNRLKPLYRRIAVFLRETGLRISEACAVEETLPVGDFLRVRGKGEKDRLVPLTATARAALDELGGKIPVGKRAIQRHFKAAGFSPHRCRHSFGTELGDSGADLAVIQDLMGHESPDTTRVYLRFNLDRMRAAVDKRAS